MPGKNSHSGPLAAVTEQDLITVLPQEVAAYQAQANNTLPVLQAAVETWGHIYHALVWLAAAKDPPGPNELIFVDANGDPILLLDSHIVPAFSGSEGGSSSIEPGGLIFGLDATFTQDKDDEFGGILFQEDAYQDYIIEGVTQPLLQHFLAKYQAHRDASGFDPQTFDAQATLDRCLNPSSPFGFHADTDGFVGNALARIQALWGPTITECLVTIDGWLAADPAAGSRAWLDAQLGIATLNVAGLFAGNNVAAKQALNNARLAFALNREIYGFVYDRFVDLDDGSLKSDGLEQVITIVTSQLADPNDRAAWAHLLTATYGAVICNIFTQTGQLVDLAEQILPVVA
jgi:hypothetical protein